MGNFLKADVDGLTAYESQGSSLHIFYNSGCKKFSAIRSTLRGMFLLGGRLAPAAAEV